jgi:hypothetical protein
VNGQTLLDLFNSPPLPSPSDIIGPTVPSSAKIQLVAGQAYTVELDSDTGGAEGPGALQLQRLDLSTRR